MSRRGAYIGGSTVVYVHGNPETRLAKSAANHRRKMARQQAQLDRERDEQLRARNALAAMNEPKNHRVSRQEFIDTWANARIGWERPKKG